LNFKKSYGGTPEPRTPKKDPVFIKTRVYYFSSYKKLATPARRRTAARLMAAHGQCGSNKPWFDFWRSKLAEQ
jgi:hypothetical protein